MSYEWAGPASRLLCDWLMSSGDCCLSTPTFVTFITRAIIKDINVQAYVSQICKLYTPKDIICYRWSFSLRPHLISRPRYLRGSEGMEMIDVTAYDSSSIH